MLVVVAVVPQTDEAFDGSKVDLHYIGYSRKARIERK